MFNIRSFCLLLLVCLAWPGAASARQDSARDGKKAGEQSDLKTAPSIENWKVLDDLKTGLDPRPPVELAKNEDAGDFVLELVRLQWRESDPVDVYVIRPKTQGKVPVVLYLYSYPSDTSQFRLPGWDKRATAGGFAAVGFVSELTGERYHTRPMKQWFVSELPESLGSSVHDVQLVLNYLESRGDMDMDHVGMFGMGSGASIAILAAHTDSRIKVLDLLDPWGDWPDWLKDSPAVPEDERSKYITPEFLKSVATLDPVVYLPSLKGRGVRVQQNFGETVTPKSAKERIAASAPEQIQVVKYTDARDLMKAWQVTGLSGWIKQQLRAEMQSDDRSNGPAVLESKSPNN